MGRWRKGWGCIVRLVLLPGLAAHSVSLDGSVADNLAEVSTTLFSGHYLAIDQDSSHPPGVYLGVQNESINIKALQPKGLGAELNSPPLHQDNKKGLRFSAALFFIQLQLDQNL